MSVERDVQIRVHALLEAIKRSTEISRQLGISRPTVYKVKATDIERKINIADPLKSIRAHVAATSRSCGPSSSPGSENTSPMGITYPYGVGHASDYAFWLHIESKACKLCPPSIAALKAAVNQEWTSMDEDIEVKVCQAFRKRLMAIVAANGGYIE
ncbi:Putative transposable element [Caligus rogercresseyi]|uniref:Transposable element n=1 Tax=Caligus rogercresseyi TaxID=217165 RepID=A0A7T8GND9_CALRO|nr:Putative transposable element [Caligus rogercresseyi]